MNKEFKYDTLNQTYLIPSRNLTPGWMYKIQILTVCNPILSLVYI